MTVLIALIAAGAITSDKSQTAFVNQCLVKNWVHRIGVIATSPIYDVLPLLVFWMPTNSHYFAEFGRKPFVHLSIFVNPKAEDLVADRKPR